MPLRLGRVHNSTRHHVGPLPVRPTRLLYLDFLLPWTHIYRPYSTHPAKTLGLEDGVQKHGESSESPSRNAEHWRSGIPPTTGDSSTDKSDKWVEAKRPERSSPAPCINFVRTSRRKTPRPDLHAIPKLSLTSSHASSSSFQNSKALAPLSHTTSPPLHPAPTFIHHHLLSYNPPSPHAFLAHLRNRPELMTSDALDALILHSRRNHKPEIEAEARRQLRSFRKNTLSPLPFERWRSLRVPSTS